MILGQQNMHIICRLHVLEACGDNSWDLLQQTCAGFWERDKSTEYFLMPNIFTNIKCIKYIIQFNAHLFVKNYTFSQSNHFIKR
jgi:hypothetical protein